VSDVNILVFNCGSSSLTYKVFRSTSSSRPEVILRGKARRVGVTGSEPSSIENRFEGQTHADVTPIASHEQAARLALDFIQRKSIPVDYVGHRFVHGGSIFMQSVFLDEQTLRTLHECIPLAPIHNPIALGVVKESRRIIPLERHYVTFDNAFHASLPPCAYRYLLPKAIAERFGFRKYGFHGLSYSYVAQQTSEFLGLPSARLRVVACHLGTGGSSVAAMLGGRSMDTSMGYSPLTGLVMSTRSGDIDPLVAVSLMASSGYRPDEVLDLLNRRSGLLGVSGFSSDIGDIIHQGSDPEHDSELAVRMYVHRLRKYVGSYIAALGGLDVLVFTDDIGVNNPSVRDRVCEHMQWAGLALDQKLNRDAPVDRIAALQAPGAAAAILTIPADEELVIYLEGMKLRPPMRVPCAAI
jgi:acetate kinase